MSDYDDWYDSAPNCGTCCDSGRVDCHRCPGCNPSWLRVRLATWRWRTWGALARWFPRSRIAARYNEPPF